MDTRNIYGEFSREEIVISLDNVGVSYGPDHRPDDYKSQIYNTLLRKGKNSDNESNMFWPLRNIDLVGYKGEILGIIGSNGSGKTTLCKLIAGVLQPDEGKIKVNGRVSALFSLALGFNKEMTGRENVYLNGTTLGISKKKISSFVDEIKEFSGLKKYFDQPIKNYSSGMKARLGFSVAAFIEPEILILDEALNTGDLEFSQKAAEKMKELVAKAKMVVIVTHSLKYAKTNCNRLMWIERGVIRGMGNPEEIVKLYEENVQQIKNKTKNNKKGLDIGKVETQKGEKKVIQSRNVGISYRLNREQHWALKNINLDIYEGEVVGIIGHNGAGKSTLCKLLTNILVPDQGELIIDGKTTALLGYGTGFNGQLTGKDNVYLNGMLLGIPRPKIKENYANIVEFSELGKKIDDPVKQYSNGMKSRLGFSVAAFLEPDIFIIDEALSAGDLSFNQKASGKIQEMIRMAKAVIVVSHSMGFVEKVCSRAVWLNQGQIMKDDIPKIVIKEYREYVQSVKKA
ncbi:ABC transporter ATP-binding protein [Paenibacillus lautus]|uniref:ABC transporter ATP-binding protein n=1 Tax=Paenibacillus lautus TaxID=1401 RepID=UPI001C7D23DA|nr:ATP-binding cassette domain-containing protein [Paenibacillus lautus]MBX4145821.1 ATP-binding cassette domain-containing protein [Paenibacillus lautus]